MQHLDLFNQWRVGWEIFRLGLAYPGLLTAPRSKTAPVILVPGWLAPEVSLTPLRWFLKTQGYDARHWGMGTNRGEPERDSALLAEKIVAMSKTTGHPVALIGWSLGGVIARETARLVPQAVASVITFGTPVVGGPTYTLGATRWGRAECERISRKIEELDQTSPITVPITAIFSRRDEVVSWPACIDRLSPKAKHFEVSSTHVSMGLDPDVWKIVAQQLRETAI
ncbi:MAG: alpha/beta fold hydrolase [Acidobacteria bacterium]|nr:alpha/beta fold hydrolase [Acidobacteriota bacterium]